jgi:hypothetical protein
MLVFLRCLIAAAGYFCWCTIAVADDVSFGADALGPLSKDATPVVTVGGARRLAADEALMRDATRARYSVYTVVVQETIRGALTVGSEIKIALPQSLNVSRTEDLAGAMLFVRLFSLSDVEETNIPATGEVFLVVNGRYVVVDPKVPDRKAAIEAYLGNVRPDAARTENVLSWTERYLNSADAFLQRSAVVDLYFERRNPQAQRQLDGALRSDQVLPAMKGTAIDALRASGTPAAAASLKDLAEDNQVHRR